MRTFQLTPDNDLMLGKTGNIAMIDGIEATAQTAQGFAATRRGEMVHSMDQGIPFFMTSFDRFPNLAQFEAALRRRLLEIETVQAVTALDVQYIDGAVKYTATLQTSDGAVQING